LPLAAPGPFTCSADRDCRLFHRHVETNIFFHGCSPFDAWARRPVVSPYFHPIGEQPPASIVGGTDSGATRSRDYPMWTAPPSGTQVPWIRELLELPRSGGAIHADDHDNRTGHREVGFSGSRR